MIRTQLASFGWTINQFYKSQNVPVPYSTMQIQNRNAHISVLNGVLWDTEQVHSGICELGQLSVDFGHRHLYHSGPHSITNVKSYTYKIYILQILVFNMPKSCIRHYIALYNGLALIQYQALFSPVLTYRTWSNTLYYTNSDALILEKVIEMSPVLSPPSCRG